MTRLVVDTGPLVALLNRRDRHHRWARSVLDAVPPPLFTCEAVLSEASWLLGQARGGREALLTLLSHGIVRVGFQLQPELAAVHALMQRFASVPMPLADACLVRMTELEADSAVITLDSDFRVYRRNRRHVVPVIMPRASGGT